MRNAMRLKRSSASATAYTCDAPAPTSENNGLSRLTSLIALVAVSSCVVVAADAATSTGATLGVADSAVSSLAGFAGSVDDGSSLD